jgi:diguanylate cyclase (GGDEF)-like protein
MEGTKKETDAGVRQARTCVGLLALAMAALSVLLFVAVIGRHHGAFDPSLHVSWLVLAVAFVLAESCALHLQFRGNTQTFTPDETLIVIALFALAPAGMVCAYALGGFIALGLIRRIKPFKLVFNLSQWSLSSLVAIAVFRALATAADPLSVHNWFAALAATLAAALVSIGAITIAITVLEGWPGATQVGRHFVFAMLGTSVNAVLGLGAVILLAESALNLLLLVGPVVIVLIAYRAYLSESSKSRSLEFLYSASGLLTGAQEFEDGLLALLDFSRETFHAEVAEVMLIGDAPNVAYRTTFGPGDQSKALDAADVDLVRPIIELAGTTERALLLRPGVGHPLAVRDGVEIASVLLATLGDDEGVRGVILLARERGAVVDTFSKEECRLFETFANHLGATIERSRLSTSLAQLQALERKLAHQAYHDSLTGLANRALFHERVDAALERAVDGDHHVTVLFIDLDDFKTVNDTLGHAAGDALLTEVAGRIASCLDDEATAARLGGDEFAVLLPSVTHELEAREVADRILVALGDPITVEGEPIVTHASIGIASHVGATDAAELMKHADVAMYTAKRNGKGRFDEFQPNMSLTVARRHQVRVGLERAISRGEFIVHYQPVIDTTTGGVIGTEALVRWKDPARGLTPPSEFVGVAEETGLIVPIGRYVLREACRQAAAWSALAPGLRVFVNLSARQLSDPDLVDDVRSALLAAQLDASQLYLEVTETAMMQNIEEAQVKMAQLKALGVGIAIDDFGTGFSSLSYLRQLPIDVLKIAKPIVDAICESKADEAFVKTIVELGHVVGLEVVAEGVEDVEQYARLVDIGCDFVQGFYYAPSMNSVDAGETIRHSAPRHLTRAI